MRIKLAVSKQNTEETHSHIMMASQRSDLKNKNKQTIQKRILLIFSTELSLLEYSLL